MHSFQLPEQLPHAGRRLFPTVARFLFRVGGWTFDNQLPNEKKVIVVAAPHTSNWDIYPASLVIYGLDAMPTIFAKDRLFSRPLKRDQSLKK